MIGYAVSSPVPLYDDAVSLAAISLRDRLAEATAPGTSVAVTPATMLRDALIAAIRIPATDGDVMPSPEVVRRAFMFARSIPVDASRPEIVIESDGEIAFDWDYGRRRVLSVSIGEGPMLRFATLIGAEPVSGRVPYAGVFPQTVAYFLRRLGPA